MRNLVLLIILLFSFGCAAGTGIQSIQLPAVQAFEYKDIVACVKVDEFFSDCKIKVDDGVFITVRIQTSEIPTDPAPAPVPE